MSDWTIERARRMYNLRQWSDGYFDISEQGHVCAYPHRIADDSPAIDLYRLVAEIQEAGLSTPVLVRFPAILQDRIRRLSAAFGRAMQQQNYRAQFTAVYPIKVNQEQSVVSQVIAVNDSRAEHAMVGLEAGSKPELMAVLALSTDNSIIVCNGYKDREYIRLALIGQKLGHRIYLVVEKLSELVAILQESQKLGIEPLLGVRVRMNSVAHGQWQNTGGPKAKFGLSATQVFQLVEQLKSQGMTHCLKLLHFHLGSQIANLQDIDTGITEAARYFTELSKEGIEFDVLDVGGGLGIDYEGTQSHSYYSINYSLEEYADTIVSRIKQVCEQCQLPHPDLVTESGRAMTAHHALLISNVIEVESIYSNLHDVTQLAPDSSLQHMLQEVTNNNGALLQQYQKAKQLMAAMREDFNNGKLSLRQKSEEEQLFAHLSLEIRKRLNPSSKAHRETLDELNETLADKYFLNFSLFQSLPDVWAINQIFPIMPLHHLLQEPGRQATLHDITCDSDGRIDHYVDAEGVESSLPLHPMTDDETYYLGIFLVGAYQEILGDMHNLFGDTNSVNVELDENGKYHLEQVLHGDTVDYVLRHVHYDTDDFMAAYRRKLGNQQLDDDSQYNYMLELQAGLTGYTYFED